MQQPSDFSAICCLTWDIRRDVFLDNISLFNPPVGD